MTDLNPTIVRQYERVSGILCLIAITAGFLVVAGWLLGIASLVSIIPGLPAMSPATAISLICTGIAIRTLADHRLTPRSRRVALLSTALPLVLCALNLVDGRFGAHLLARDFAARLGIGSEAHRSQMALSTTLCLVFLNVSVHLLCARDWPRRSLPSQILVIGALGISGGTVVAYGYGLLSVENHVFTRMAIHTAASILLLSIAVLLCRPRHGLMGVVTSDLPGGYLARRLLPAAVLIPVILDWSVAWAETSGLLSPAVGPALVIVTIVTLFSGLIWRYASEVSRLTKEWDRTSENVRELTLMRDLRERFVSALSHDLRTPLTAIKVSADLGLRYPDRCDSHPKLFRRIGENIGRADRMIRDRSTRAASARETRYRCDSRNAISRNLIPAPR